MKTNSLAIRLFVSSAAWTLLVLPIAAMALISMNRGIVERNVDEQIDQDMDYLVGHSEPGNGVGLQDPGNLPQSLYTAPFSGWYWQIKPLGGAGEPILKSASLVSETLKTPTQFRAEPDSKQVYRSYVDGPDNQSLRIVERRVVHMNGDEREVYIYSVTRRASDIEDQVRSFTTMVVVALSVLGTGLLVATFFQVRFGLMPLRDIGARLAAIRSGDAARLEGELPDEIMPLQRELNELIQSNHDIVERSRTHVGNLAHALKTPLSVITNEARGRPEDFAAKIVEQASIMGEHITHHLARAQAAARAGAVGGVTPIRPALNSVINALRRIYTERELEFDFACPDDAKFPGEKADFQEMAGNLLDNACKWARSKVDVKVMLDSSGASLNGQSFIVLLVDDDGPGLSAEARAAGAKRGKRLDETKPGTGLGLSIVVDLAHMYKGECTLEVAPIGGLRARLVLPTV
jgi:signal transduction histidine kinase